MTIIKLCTIFALFLAFTATPVRADSDEESAKPAHHGWHFPRVSVNVGGNWEKYTGENAAAANQGFAIAGGKHFDFDFALGIHLNPGHGPVLLGVIFDSASDSWTNSPNFVTVTQLMFGAEATYFFCGEAGKGFYGRGDLGLATFNSAVGYNSGRTTQGTTTSSPMGFGVRAGTGYAFKVGDRTSILASLDFGFRKAGASTAMPLTLSVGVLF